MHLKSEIKDRIKDQQERYLIKARRAHEIRKFKDPRRVRIFESVELTAEQMRQIDDLYIKNYGEKIPYTWHRHYTAFTGKFDPSYFPELLYIPEFEYFMNPDRRYQDVFDNKNILPLLAKSVGIHMPTTAFSSANGVIRDNQYCISDIETIQRRLSEGVYFAKPAVESGSGKGCILLDTGDEAFMQKIEALGKDYVVQERIRCSKSVAALHPESVNTFRVMTYIWKGSVEIVPVIMRIGQGASFLDNAHAGGMFIAVNPDGTLHEKAFTEFRDIFLEHPNTHIQFKGYQIQNYRKVIDAAVKMHSAIPQVGVVNWDFTIDENEEPVLIEANTRSGGIWIFEMAWGCGAFGEKTPEILRWIRDQKKQARSKRQ